MGHLDYYYLQASLEFAIVWLNEDLPLTAKLANFKDVHSLAWEHLDQWDPTHWFANVRKITLKCDMKAVGVADLVQCLMHLVQDASSPEVQDVLHPTARSLMVIVARMQAAMGNCLATLAGKAMLEGLAMDLCTLKVSLSF